MKESFSQAIIASHKKAPGSSPGAIPSLKVFLYSRSERKRDRTCLSIFYVCASSLSPFSLQQKAFGIQIEAASQTVLCFHLVCGWRGVVRLCFMGGWYSNRSGKVRRCNGVESVTSLEFASSRILTTGLAGENSTRFQTSMPRE